MLHNRLESGETMHCLPDSVRLVLARQKATRANWMILVCLALGLVFMLGLIKVF